LKYIEKYPIFATVKQSCKKVNQHKKPEPLPEFLIDQGLYIIVDTQLLTPMLHKDYFQILPCLNKFPMLTLQKLFA